MASTVDYVNFVCDQIRDVGILRYRKMFGEYMVYINEKPILMVCDNTVYVKNLECIRNRMVENNAELGFPYKGAKEHFILDIENREFSQEILEILEKVIAIPKPKNKKKNGI